MTTPETIKNPQAQVKIKCSHCRREYPIDTMLQERPLPPPRETVVEGLIVCPECGTEKHSYYMTEALRFKQVELVKLLNAWNSSHDLKDWSKYQSAQRQYQKTFDTTQQRYAAIVEKEASSGRPKE